MRYYKLCISLLMFITAAGNAEYRQTHFTMTSDPDYYRWEMRTDIDSHLSYRIGSHNISTQLKRQKQFVRHSGDITHQAATALLDWYPYGGNLRLTTGLFVASHELEFISEPFIDYSAITSAVNNMSAGKRKILDLAVVGAEFVSKNNDLELSANTPADKVNVVLVDRRDLQVDGYLSYRPFAPYLGIGWANKPGSTNRLRFNFDIGLVYVGKPDLNMSLSGRIMHVDSRLTGKLQTEFAEAVQRLRIKTQDYKILPSAFLEMSVQF